MARLIQVALLILAASHAADGQKRRRDFGPFLYGRAAVSITATTASDGGGVVELTIISSPKVHTRPFQLAVIRQWADSAEKIMALKPKVEPGETVDLDLPAFRSISGSLEWRWKRSVGRAAGYTLTSIQDGPLLTVAVANLTAVQMTRLVAALREACEYAERLAAAP